MSKQKSMVYLLIRNVLIILLVAFVIGLFVLRTNPRMPWACSLADR